MSLNFLCEAAVLSFALSLSTANSVLRSDQRRKGSLQHPSVRAEARKDAGHADSARCRDSSLGGSAAAARLAQVDRRDPR